MEQTEMQAAWGTRIRRLRQSRELTVTFVAEQVGITRRYLYALEHGQYAPSVSVQMRIADALGVEPGEIFSYDLKDAS
jgi:transcriptional regulator with XRE-family HTH domain